MLLLDETPYGDYKNDAFENNGVQMYTKLIVFDKTPRAAYKHYALEDSGAQMYTNTCCCLMRHAVRLMKTMPSATAVRKYILKLVIYR